MPSQLEDTFDEYSPGLRIELTELLTKRLRDELSVTDLARLEAIVTSDNHACQLYVQLGFETAVLLRYASRWRAMEPGHVSQLLSNVDDTLPQSVSPNTALAIAALAMPNDSSTADQAVGVMSATRNVASVLLRQPRLFFSRPVLTYVALVALCLYGSFALIAWNLRPDKLPSFAASSSESVAMVRDTTDVQWSSDSRLTAARGTRLTGRRGKSIHPGEPLKIESGTMELELKAGTKLIVEGPADWSVDGNNSISLRAGKLLARVPEQAIGFTIETAAAILVDLGTEFAVQVNRDGATEVQVLVGEVALKPSNHDPLKPPSHETILSAGMARRIHLPAPGKSSVVQEIEWNPHSFTRRLNPRSRRIPVRAVQASGAALQHHGEQLVGLRPYSRRGLSGDRNVRKLYATKHQTFDRSLADWKLLKGNKPGWIDGNLTAGQPAGEVGGVFVLRDLLADETLGGSLTLDDSFFASGEFYVGDADNCTNRAIAIGFLDPAIGPRQTVGVQIANWTDRASLRFFAAFSDSVSMSQGDARRGTAIHTNSTIAEKTAYRFEFRYDPTIGDGQLRAKLFDTAGKQIGADSVYDLTPDDRENGASLSCFGIESHIHGSLELRLDSVEYTSIQGVAAEVPPDGEQREYLLFDLGQIERLDSVIISTQSGQTSQDPSGIKVNIFAANSAQSDPVSHPDKWLAVTKEFPLQLPTSERSISAPQSISLGGTRARYVAVLTKSFESISKLQFFGEPKTND
jgi:hypothetical protein